MLYKIQIEQAMGQKLPQMEEGQMPPEVMNEIALAAATATQQVTGQAQAMAQAMQNAQVDPVVEIKKEEIAQRAQSDALRSEVDLARIESQEAIAEMKVAQDREEAMLKAQNESTKTYGQILKDVRSSDTKTKGS